MSTPLPEMPDFCWPIDTSCCGEQWDDYDEGVQAYATALAGQTLRMLTGFRVGGCPIALRPCRKGCGGPRTWMTWPMVGSGSWAGAGTQTGWMTPTVSPSGAWLNIACGCGADGCSCSTVCEVVVPGVVGSIAAVWVDGVEIDPSAYRVDNGNRIVRTDAECWPLCQDMSAGPHDEGAFTIEYVPGIAVDGLGAYAAGLLACEYAKAMCNDRTCRLPANTVQVVRQGVSLDLAQQPFADGVTGIREVDLYVARYNPTHLASPSQVWWPGARGARTSLGGMT